MVGAHYVDAGGGGGTGYSAVVLADSPTLYLRQGEGSGATMVDSSGHGRNGAYSGGVTQGVTGLVTGDADTANDYFGGQGVVPYASALDGGGSIAIDAIINPDSVAGGSFNFIVNAADNGTAGPWWFILNAGHLEFAVATGGGGLLQVTGATAISPGTKYHVGAIYDGTTVKVYVNGVEDASASKSGTLNVTAQDLWVGNWSTSPLTFLGVIDEVALYASLTPTRMAVHAANV